MDNTNSNKVLIAGLLGFLAGILYAPRKGSETQEQLKAGFEDVKTQVKKKADQARSKYDRSKQAGNDAVSSVDDKIDEVAEDLSNR